MQIVLFALAVLAGCRMLFIIDKKSWLINMRQVAVFLCGFFSSENMIVSSSGDAMDLCCRSVRIGASYHESRHCWRLRLVEGFTFIILDTFVLINQFYIAHSSRYVAHYVKETCDISDNNDRVCQQRKMI
jgi:hypothetical protein